MTSSFYGKTVCFTFVALVSVILCSISLNYHVQLITKWRANDMFNATDTVSFAALGTCIDRISVDQLEYRKYHKAGCGDDKEKFLRESLAVSVHGLYYLKSKDNDNDLHTVASSVIATTLGTETADADPISRKMAYKALKKVAEYKGMPNKCEELYYANVSHPETQIASDADVQTFFNRIMTHKDDSGANEAYMAWPIRDPHVDCSMHDLYGQPPSSPPPPPTLENLTSTEVLKMYAHCRAQFLFASSGQRPMSGSMGVPMVGAKPGPYEDNVFTEPEHFARDYNTNYETKTKIYLGQRFGYSMWAYIPMLLATSYLLTDALVLLVAALTAAARFKTTSEKSPTFLAYLRTIAVRLATNKISRLIRRSIGTSLVLVSFITYAIFIAQPWGENKPNRLLGVVGMGV